MAVLLRIPTPLRKLTGGKAEVAAEGASVREVLDNVEASHPGVRDKILEPSGGGVRRFINVFVNGEDIRHIQGLDTRLKPGDELSIVPAIAGGGGRG
jgi:sulfur-carrier protein